MRDRQNRPPQPPAPPLAPSPATPPLAARWRSTSLPKKILVLLLPVALGSIVIIFRDEPRPIAPTPTLTPAPALTPTLALAPALTPPLALTRHRCRRSTSVGSFVAWFDE